MSELVPLKLLRPGETAGVGEVLGSTEDVRRLEELGLRKGTQIQMVQPGSPCIIRVGRQRLCFRADELTSVLVRPAGAAT